MRHLTNWHKDFPKPHQMPYNTFIDTEIKKMTNYPNYKLRIVIYNQKRYYQFIPENIYGYIEELPMWKFIKNAMAGEILENKCFLISKQ